MQTIQPCKVPRTPLCIAQRPKSQLSLPNAGCVCLLGWQSCWCCCGTFNSLSSLGSLGSLGSLDSLGSFDSLAHVLGCLLSWHMSSAMDQTFLWWNFGNQCLKSFIYMYITMPEELEPLPILVFVCRQKAWCAITLKNVLHLYAY